MTASTLSTGRHQIERRARGPMALAGTVSLPGAGRLRALITERDDRIAADRRNGAVQSVAEADLAGRFVERVDAAPRRFVGRIDHVRPQNPIAGKASTSLSTRRSSPSTKRSRVLVAERLLDPQLERVLQHRRPRQREREVRRAVRRAEQFARQRLGGARPDGVQVSATQRRQPVVRRRRLPA